MMYRLMCEKFISASNQSEWNVFKVAVNELQMTEHMCKAVEHMQVVAFFYMYFISIIYKLKLVKIGYYDMLISTLCQLFLTQCA